MFLTSRHAAGGDRSPWGNFWFEPVGMRSSTGTRVTSASAMRLSAVYSCVRVLAETFAILPFALYRKGTDGGRTPVTDHWLYHLLARRPNAWQTPFEWREMMMGHLALRGNAFNEIVANRRGEITDLLPLHPDRVRIELLDSGDYRFAVANRDGTNRTLLRGQVWHLRGMSSDGIIGLNPIEVAADVLGMGVAAQAYGARFFANDAKPGGWIELPGKFADEPTRQTFKDSWKKSQGGGNRGATAVLENGMKYHELKLNNSDNQFIESRKYSRSEIAAMFRVPPHKIGDLEKATFSNIEQQSLDFVNDTMTPWAERWESSIEANLLFDDDDLCVEFEFRNLLRGDSKARASYYNSGIVSGWLTRNEARIQEGMNPLQGLDEPLQPLNMVEAGEQPALLPDPDDAKPAADDEKPGARVHALAKAAAQRVARKEVEIWRAAAKAADWPTAIAEAYAKHAQFVATVLNVSVDAAQAYCVARQNDPIRKGHEEADFMSSALTRLVSLALKGTP